MKNPLKKALLAFTLLLLVGVSWFAISTSGAPGRNTAETEESGPVELRQRKLPPENRKRLEGTSHLELESLGQLLPDWLRDSGSLLQDRREIGGHIVLRSRGRYEWENGESLEIEITDTGGAPDEALLKSLGFNPDFEAHESEAGFTATSVQDGYIINQEYDFNDQAGSLQMIIDNRYLVEIQIQQLPEETFQGILDEQIPFDEIFTHSQIGN